MMYEYTARRHKTDGKLQHSEKLRPIAVAQLVEALLYKPEGHRFNFRWSL